MPCNKNTEHYVTHYTEVREWSLTGHLLHACPNQLNSIPLAHYSIFPYKNQALLFTVLFDVITCCRGLQVEQQTSTIITIIHRNPFCGFRTAPWLKETPVTHHGDPGSILGQSMLDLWWTNWPRSKIFSEYFSSPLPVLFLQCSILTHSSITDTT
jgi:hypothetical protein